MIGAIVRALGSRAAGTAAATQADDATLYTRKWPNELRERVGQWDAVRPLVEDAYSKARSSGVIAGNQSG